MALAGRRRQATVAPERERRAAELGTATAAARF
jgi:hypothetical protein